MKNAPFFVFAGWSFVLPLIAGEVVLYDCDYSNSTAVPGQSVPLAGLSFPGRTSCSSINFGHVNLEPAPAVWSGTAAVLHSQIASPNYSQMEFFLVSGAGVYAFRKHRLEMTFMFLNPAGLTGGEGLSVFTDGGVTYSLHFASNGGVYLEAFRRIPPDYWGNDTERKTTAAGTFNPASPIHLVWETDIKAGRTTVTVNGNSTTVSGLGSVNHASRNQTVFLGPLSIRLSLADAGSDAPMALRSLRITGDDCDGPLLGPVDLNSPYVESDVVMVPLQFPATGNWQPEFSTDGVQWEAFGGVQSNIYPLQTISFGKQIAPMMFVRLAKVP